MVHWGWVGWRMQLRDSFVPTEKAMACAMAAEEGKNGRSGAASAPTTPTVRPMDHLGSMLHSLLQAEIVL